MNRNEFESARRKHRQNHEVVILIEQMEAARHLSSCCVGVEAILDSKPGLLKRCGSLLNGWRPLFR